MFFRDVEHILGIVLLAWYFLTPILFPIAILANRPQELQLMYLNPMTSIIVGFQRALLDGLPPEWGPLAYSACFALDLRHRVRVLPAREGRLRGRAVAGKNAAGRSVLRQAWPRLTPIAPSTGMTIVRIAMAKRDCHRRRSRAAFRLWI